MADIEPKVVLVTGASSGIGKACSEHLAAGGYRVFGTQRRVSPDSATRGVQMIAMDVDDDRSVEAGLRGVTLPVMNGGRGGRDGSLTTWIAHYTERSHW
jgi:NADP-dependent 3-hydroxy acid dehydrogenase YdfG